MRLTENTPVDANDYTWGQRGDGSRRLPGLADISYFTDVFDPRLNVLTGSDTHHESNVVYSWGLDDAQNESGGFMPAGDKGFPSMGELGDTPETNEAFHGYGIKGEDTRLSEENRHPQLEDNNPNVIWPAEWDQRPELFRISEKPVPTPGRGPGDNGMLPGPSSPQELNPFYNMLGVSKRFSETMSHGDLGLPVAALPDWHEFAVPNAAPTPTSWGATEPNTRTRQSTFTTLRIPPSQWTSADGLTDQSYDRWGA